MLFGRQTAPIKDCLARVGQYEMNIRTQAQSMKFESEVRSKRCYVVGIFPMVLSCPCVLTVIIPYPCPDWGRKLGIATPVGQRRVEVRHAVCQDVRFQ